MNDIFNNLFIFDMANNHQGSLSHGLKIIKAVGKIARKYGIRAGLKFQYRDVDTFIHKNFINRKDINKHIPRFLTTRLKPNEFSLMAQAVKDEGLITVCTPFDERSVDLLLDQGIEIIKVASCSANDWFLLDKINQTHKPVICSTGGLALNKIDNIVSFFAHRDAKFALLHCVSLYPVPAEYIQANFIGKLARRFPDITIGYSGHEAPDDTDTIKVAIAKGAKIFERHVGVAADGVKLNAYSMNPEQAELWVKSALRAFEICGVSDDKKITQDEVDSIKSLIRGAYAKKNIKKGETLSPDKVYLALPCLADQTTASEYIDTLVASRDYKADQAIEERRPFNKIFLIREVVHEAKGLLYEANISVAKDFSIEISHHCGVEHVRQFGATIINIVNRKYCKKLIIMLPGQKHPSHYHKIKEETFQLLWGDLEVILDGSERIDLKPGEIALVKAGTKHSFSSVNGAIFEEISTTHILYDSCYENEELNKKDLMERKTLVGKW